MSTPNNARPAMWQAIVYTEGRTPCGISSGTPEYLPGLHGSPQEAMVAAIAAMKDRPELYCCTAKRVEVKP